MSGLERKLDEEELIVSKSDLDGRITYCNDSFMAFSGYEENEVLGKRHDLIRHPDVPLSVHRYMQRQIESGKEFFGVAKYLTKEGDYYWCFSNIAQSFDNKNEAIGYHSVNRMLKPKLQEFMEPVYKSMCLLEKNQNESEAALDEAENLFMQSFNGREYDEFICSFYR